MFRYFLQNGFPDIDLDCQSWDQDYIDFEEFSHCLFHLFLNAGDPTLTALDRDENGYIDFKELSKITAYDQEVG